MELARNGVSRELPFGTVDLLSLPNKSVDALPA
jgi:hypothetical protein